MSLQFRKTAQVLAQHGVDSVWSLSTQGDHHREVPAPSRLESNLRPVVYQLEKINLEIEQRKILSEKILTQLKDRIAQLMAVKNDPTALLDYSEGKGFLMDREHVNQLIRETRHQISVEECSCWNDLQKLQWEKRIFEREKMKLEFNLRIIGN